MPELPEVETVRAGLSRHVPGRRVVAVQVTHPRAVRRHAPGAPHFAAGLVGRTLLAPRRRGKFLWFPLDDDRALVAHLGMSGQLLVAAADVPDQTHLRVRLRFADGDPELRFVDQRTFGGMLTDELVGPGAASGDGPGGDDRVPATVAHIARDPLDPRFDAAAFSRRLRAGRREVKTALLDQTLVSGIGNIYADETLWRARLSGRRRTDTLGPAHARTLLACARAVLTEAVAAGGTSFDRLYVSAEGTPGWFERALAAYGREGLPCPRCGTPIRREAYANRSSFSCPRCQRAPRLRPPPAGVKRSGPPL